MLRKAIIALTLLLMFPVSAAAKEKVLVQTDNIQQLISETPGAELDHAYNIVPDLYLLEIKESKIPALRSAVGKKDFFYDRSAHLLSSAPTVKNTPSDWYNYEPWGMEAIGAREAWGTFTGSRNTVVAVVDTGVDLSHPDLVNNLWQNSDEIEGNGVDDDNNGYVDDRYGWDFVNNDPIPADDHGHGTHVAGTIGAEGNNDIGVPGVNWQTAVMPLKACDDQGACSIADAVQALEYAVDNGAHISNHSYGGYYGGFPWERAAIEAAGGADHLYVAAAGNSAGDNDVTYSYPASYGLDNQIAVAAIDHALNLAGFSNYGQTTVQLAAPGTSVVSTDLNGTYSSRSGTSMAAPHVSGAAALLHSAGDRGYLSLKSNLIDGSSDLARYSDWIAAGRLSLPGALALVDPPEDPTPPPPPPPPPPPVDPDPVDPDPVDPDPVDPDPVDPDPVDPDPVDPDPVDPEQPLRIKVVKRPPKYTKSRQAKIRVQGREGATLLYSWGKKWKESSSHSLILKELRPGRKVLLLRLWESGESSKVVRVVWNIKR